VLRGLLSQEFTKHQGEEYRRVALQLVVPGAKPPPLYFAALGPQMLRLAGQLADGVAIQWGGPKYLASFALPLLKESSSTAGRPMPRIALGQGIVVTDRPDEILGQAAEELAPLTKLPSYRAVCDQEGASGLEEVIIIGDERAARAQLEELERLGVTDFNACLLNLGGNVEIRQRTYQFLAAVARERA
jgi:alkanesulfonate monooxygenase SsuD/methylene tetrahydromethanopterin reductase-like flavin-dependent oxidoreductase (luciferase family)